MDTLGEVWWLAINGYLCKWNADERHHLAGSITYAYCQRGGSNMPAVFQLIVEEEHGKKVHLRQLGHAVSDFMIDHIEAMKNVTRREDRRLDKERQERLARLRATAQPGSLSLPDQERGRLAIAERNHVLQPS